MVYKLELKNTKLFFCWLQWHPQQKLKYFPAEVWESWIALPLQKGNSQEIPYTGVQS